MIGVVIAAMAVLPALADVPPPPAPVSITAGADEGTGEASVDAGSRLLVRLSVAGGTGYSWKLMGDAAPELSLVAQRTERQPGGRLGAPQQAVFEFDAQAAGQKELTFGFFAPGGTDETAPAKTYVLTVTISE